VRCLCLGKNNERSRGCLDFCKKHTLGFQKKSQRKTRLFTSSNRTKKHLEEEEEEEEEVLFLLSRTLWFSERERTRIISYFTILSCQILRLSLLAREKFKRV
jgi:hypothetical protein